MLRTGTILHGTYRIESYLSSGGFGNTYVATNVEFDERVALKEFFMKGVTQRDSDSLTVSVSNRDNTEQFEEQREKFKKEARRLRKLHNNHLVRVHDLFEENGTAYYVMDYVDGESLSALLKRTGQPLTEAEVWKILPQVLDALRTVHGQGIWHLDLKPSNIMMDRDGTVKIIDFGASKQMSGKQGGATTSTAVSYTNGFAPREQMEQNLDKFGPWTDLYALGATLYNLLSGKRPPLPTDIDDDTSADKHFALPLPAAVSQKMRQLVLWLMSTNRMLRPQSVEEVQKRLQEPAGSEVTIVGQKPKPAPRPQPEPTPEDDEYEDEDEDEPRPQYLKWLAIGGGALALLLAIIFGARGCGNAAHPGTTDSVSAEAADTVAAALSLRSETLGNYEYSGDLDGQGRPDGQGTAWYDDGSRYEGSFKAGKLNGNGTYYNSDGSYFKGNFKNDANIEQEGHWYNQDGTLQ